MTGKFCCYKKYADLVQENENEEFLSGLPFRKFKDQGMILYANGYSGAIEVANSTFTSNMAYI